MRGLLKNNLYAACANAKTFAVTMALLGIFVIAVFSLQKENSSKWGKYKLTAPVRRSDIVKSYFVSQLIWLMAGIMIAVFAIGMSMLLHGFPLDRGIDIILLLTLGISVSLLMNAIFFPIHYLGNSEKNEVFLIISLLCAIGLVMALSSFTNWFFGPNMTTNQLLICIAVIIFFAVSSFILSFPLTALAFRKAEY